MEVWDTLCTFFLPFMQAMRNAKKVSINFYNPINFKHFHLFHNNNETSQNIFLISIGFILGSIDDEKSLYINTDTYRKLDKKRASLLSQESENLNANTFTKTSKPKRVESFIRKIEKNLWRRKDTKKEPSPAPSSHSSDQSTIKRSKNIFNLISGGRKSTREVEIQCKMDEEKDYYGGIGTRKSSNGNEKKFSITRPLRAFQQKNYENGSNQRLTSIMKSSPQQQQPDHRLREYESNKKSSTPAPIRIEIDLRNTNKRPIGVASPLPQKTRSALKNGNNIKSKSGNYDSGYKKPPEITKSHAPSRLQVNADNGNDLRRDGNERVSFREYREQLRAAKTENRQKITDTSDDDLRRSYQQSFFVPM